VFAASFTVAGGQTVPFSVGLRGLAPEEFSLRMLQTTTTSGDFPFAPAGSGQGAASSRANNSPFVKTAIPAVAGITNGSNRIDLAGFFSDPDITNSTVRFDTSRGPINV